MTKLVLQIVKSKSNLQKQAQMLLLVDKSMADLSLFVILPV